MPTSKTAASQRSGANKIFLVVIAIVLSIVGYLGFGWVRGLMMLGYVDSAIVRMRLLYAAEMRVTTDEASVADRAIVE